MELPTFRGAGNRADSGAAANDEDDQELGGAMTGIHNMRRFLHASASQRSISRLRSRANKAVEMLGMTPEQQRETELLALRERVAEQLMPVCRYPTNACSHYLRSVTLLKLARYLLPGTLRLLSRVCMPWNCLRWTCAGTRCDKRHFGYTNARASIPTAGYITHLVPDL